MLAELGMSHLSTGRINDDTGAPGGASTLTSIRTKADAAKSEADDVIKWVTKNDPRIRETRSMVEDPEKRMEATATKAELRELAEDMTDKWWAR